MFKFLLEETTYKTIMALGTVVVLVVGSLSYFATAADVKLVEQRLDQKIVSDNVMDLQKRVWVLEDVTSAALGRCTK